MAWDIIKRLSDVNWEERARQVQVWRKANAQAVREFNLECEEFRNQARERLAAKRQANWEALKTWLEAN